MVAIVSGNSLGLSNSSAALLGQNGLNGQAANGANNQKVVVNAATGNLVLANSDDFLAAQGLDINSQRTYNSQGNLNQGNGLGWSMGMIEQVGNLTGTVNTAGSTITRTEGDGSQIVYTYNTTSGLYVGHEGSGANDTISYNGGTSNWTWTNGGSGATQVYGSNGNIISASDSNGNTLTYGYTNGLLTSIADADGESVTYSYNANGYLSQITDNAAGGSTVAVNYNYDSQNRLTNVTVQLGAAAGNTTYWTNYTYQGTTNLVASVIQQDGSAQYFTYTAQNQVHTVTDALGNVTTFSYGSGSTAVTDPLGNTVTYTYDGQGRLTQVSAPVNVMFGASSATGIDDANGTQHFFYNANGNLEASTDALGNGVVYTYDGNGNMLSQVDSLGETTSYTYNTYNKLTSKTVYLTPANSSTSIPASNPETTYYVYDANNQLAYQISAQGRVTQYNYNYSAYSSASGSGGGELASSITYAGNFYNIGALSPSNLPTISQVSAWVGTAGNGSVDLTQSLRTDYTYDLRGQLASSTSYASVSSSGVASGAATTHYTYSPSGQLLQTIDGDGNTTSYTHDTLGRLLGSTNAAHNSSVYAYNNTGAAAGGGVISPNTITSTVTNTAANGLTTVSAYNAGGELISVTQSGSGIATATTTYAYDADGHLVKTTNPDGQSGYFLYDADGRQVASIDPAGILTQYVYNADNQLTATNKYATPVNVAVLFDSNGLPTNQNLSLLTTGALYSTTWNSYDAAGRLAASIDGLGETTVYSYDGASNLVETAVMRANNAQYLYGPNPLTITMPTGLGLVTSRLYYDADNLEIGTLNADGYLTQYVRNGAGQVTQSISYATMIPTALQSGSLAAMIASAQGANNAGDIYQTNFYNDAGQLAYALDGDGYLSAYTYDGAGNLTNQTRYAAQATVGGAAAVGHAQSGISLANIVWSAGANDQSTSTTYTALNQVATQTAPNGALTQYSYNSVGNLISTTVSGGGVSRTAGDTYNLLGQLVSQTSPNGGITTYTYDAAGNRTSVTDADGNRTLYYYDADNRLIYSIDGAGDVQGQTWNNQGQIASTTSYAVAIAATTLATMTGGLLSAAPAALSTLNALPSAFDRTSTFAYNAGGELVSSTDPLGYTVTRNYDAFGDLTQQLTQVDSAGDMREQDVTYDNRGQAIATTTKDNRNSVSGSDTVTATTSTSETTSYSYDAFGRVIQATDANGNVSNKTYDQLGRVLSVSDPASGAQEHSTYDAFGRVLTQTDFLGNSTSFQYNTAARSMTITSSMGVTQTIVDNIFGQQVAVTNGDGNTTNYNYDTDGNLTSVTDALGTIASETYNGNNQVATSTDANGVVTQYTYDAANRVLSKTVDPATVGNPGGLNLVTSYTYNTSGQVLSATDPKGVVTQTTYDKKGEVLSIAVDPSGLNLVTTYSYDARGMVLSVTNPDGAVTAYQYDALGRRVAQTVDPTGLNLTTSFRYDADNNVIASIDPNGNITRYVHDADNRVTYQVDAAGGVVHNVYDADGHIVTSTRYANAVNTNSLPSVGTPLTAALITSLLTPDATRDNNVNNVFDNAGRLVFSMDSTGAVTQRSYDGNGNLLKTTTYAGTIASSTPLTISALTTAVAAIANPAVDNTSINVYDARNRVVDHINGDGDLTTYQYDNNGNLILRITASMPGNLASLPSNPTQAQVLAWWAASGGVSTLTDSKVYMAYDSAGRLTATVTRENVNSSGVMQWAVVKYTYDGDGNETSRTAFATTLSGSTVGAAAAATDTIAGSALPVTATTQAQWLAWINTVTPNSALDHVTQMAYDNAGRMTFSATAQHTDSSGNVLWSVKQCAYDNDGNCIATTAYANFLSSATQSSFATTSAWIASAAANPNPALDQMNRMVYDHAGRMVASATAQSLSGSTVQWAVTAYTFDANGNVIGRTAYASLLAGTAVAGLAATNANQGTVATWMASVTTSALQDHMSLMVYDADNRITASATVQSSNGTATQWSVVTTKYDAIGNVLSTTAYANTISSAMQVPYGSAAAWIASVVANPAADRTTRNVFNTDNRLIYSIDALGYVTQTSYDALGRVKSTTLYSNPVTLSGSVNAANVSAAIAAAGAPVTPNRTSSYSYDGAGNLTASTDADGNTDSYTYDAVGNKLTHTNALGNTWTYQYDAAGQLILETDPAVTVTTVTPGTAGAGGVFSPTTTSASAQLQTATTYDAFGNVASSTAAAGQPNARTTSYAYDLAGRQTTVIYPTVQVYAAGSASSATLLAAAGSTTGLSATQAASLLTTVTPTSTVTYDALGNAIVNQDVGGNYSYMVYNNAGRVAYAVDAAGNVTGYTYDAFGRSTTQTRYALAVTVPAPTAGSAENTVNTLATLLSSQTGNALTRVVTTVYDQLGRVVRVIEPPATTYDYGTAGALSGGSMSATMASQTIDTTYDAFGDAILTSVYGSNNLGSNGAFQRVTAAQQTYSSFNQRGQMTAQVVAAYDIPDNGTEGYLTTMTYDAAGNLIAQDQFATAVYGAGLQGSGAYIPSAVASATDRVTTYTYDADNRKTSQTLNGATTSYGYDKLGNQVSVTDALGGTTYSYFDTLGRVIATATTADSGSDVVADSGTPSILLTVFNLDIYGNVVRQVNYINGATAANASSFTASTTTPSAAAGDQISFNVYDNDSRRIENINASGDASYTDYDAFGRVALQWQNVTTASYAYAGPATPTTANADFNPGGQAAPTVTAKTQADYSITTYDADGRVTSVVTPGQVAAADNGAVVAPASVNTETNTYDAFGDVVARSMNGTQTQFTDYDNAGRAWLTNANNGIVTGTLYNVDGQATEQLTSTTTDLAQSSSEAAMAALYANNDTNLLATGSRYDLQGNVIDHLAVAQLVGTNVAASTLLGLAVTVPPASAIVSTTATDTSSNKTVDGGWSGTNSVTVALPPQITALGSGDIQVELTYTTTQSTSMSTFQSFSADAVNPNSSTVTMSWNSTTAQPAPPISAITGISVWKKDITGQWQLIAQSTNNPSTTTQPVGTFLQIPAPQNALTQVNVTYGPVGGQQTLATVNVPGQQNSAPLYNFGGYILLDLSGLPVGSYSYTVQYQDTGDTTLTQHDSGTFTLAGVTGTPATPTASAAASSAAELFVALLNRAPMSTDLNTYVSALTTGGKSMSQAAQTLLAGSEALADFAGATTPSAFVTAVLNNVLGASASGTALYQSLYTQYTTMLSGTGANTAANQAAAAAGVITSVMGYTGTDAASLTAARLFANKVAIGVAYAGTTTSVTSPGATDLAAAALAIADVAAYSTNYPNSTANAEALGANAIAAGAASASTGLNLEAATAPYQAAQALVTQLFIAVYGRAPISNVIRSDANQLVAGTTTAAALAQSLLTSAEATTSPVNTNPSYVWGTAINNATTFVTQAFQTIYGSAPTSAQLSTYTAGYTSASAGQTLVNILNSLLASGTSYANQLALLNDKVSVGLTYAITFGGSSTAQALAVINAVTTGNTAAAMADIAGYAGGTAQTTYANNSTTQATNVSVKDSGAVSAAAANANSNLALVGTQLYVAILNRTPDAVGFLSILNALGVGGTTALAANELAQATAMFSSVEGKADYPSSMTVGSFINTFYSNAFGRAPETAEYNAAVTALGGSATATLAAVTPSAMAGWAVSAMNAVANYTTVGQSSIDINQLSAQFFFNARVAEAMNAAQAGVASTSVTETKTSTYMSTVAAQNVVANYVGPAQTISSNPVGTARMVAPDTHITYDRWGNALSVSNPNNQSDLTYTTYNAYNEATATYTAKVQFSNSGQPGQFQSTTRMATGPSGTPAASTTYDALGRATSSTDANGNVTQYDYNGFGNVDRVVDADGGINVYTNNGLGQRTSYEQLDPTANTTTGGVTQYNYNVLSNTTYAYDLLGHEIESRSATVTLGTVTATGTAPGTVNATAINLASAVFTYSAAEVTLFAYDEFGRETLTMTTGSNTGLTAAALTSLQHDNVSGVLTALAANPALTANYTQYDLAGNVAATIDGDGHITSYGYDAFGDKVAETDADGNKQSWTMLQVGSSIVKAWTEMDGVVATNAYNQAGQLTSTIASGSAPGSTAPAQNLAYTYNGTLLASVTDKNTNISGTAGVYDSVTKYTYDLAGNQLSSQETVATGLKNAQGVATGQATALVQDVHESYDALNRQLQVEDGRYDLQYAYDANGNVINIDTTYQADSGPTTMATTAVPGNINTTANAENVVNFSIYDAMNRAILIDGTDVATTSSGLVAGTSVYASEINATQGHILTYNTAGQRTSDTYDAPVVFGGQTLNLQTTESYVYDGASQLVQIVRKDAEYGSNVINNLIYNAAGAVVTSGVATAAQTSLGMATFSSTTSLGDGITSANETGNSTAPITSLSATQATAAAVQAYHLNNTSVDSVFDKAGRMTIQTAWQANAGGDVSDTTYGYDQVGNVLAVSTHQHMKNGAQSNTVDTVNYLRYTWVQGANYNNTVQTTQTWNGATNVQVAGTTTNGTTLVYDDNNNLVQTVNYDGPNGTAGPASDTSNYIGTVGGQILDTTDTVTGVTTHSLIVGNQSLGNSSTATAGAGNTIGTDTSYATLETTAASTQSSVYVVQTNDTWASIAYALWGDGSLAWALEQANGNYLPAAGGVISVPPRPNAVENTYQTYTPYSRSSATGNLTPSAPTMEAGMMLVAATIAKAVKNRAINQGLAVMTDSSVVNAHNVLSDGTENSIEGESGAFGQPIGNEVATRTLKTHQYNEHLTFTGSYISGVVPNNLTVIDYTGLYTSIVEGDFGTSSGVGGNSGGGGVLAGAAAGVGAALEGLGSSVEGSVAGIGSVIDSGTIGAGSDIGASAVTGTVGASGDAVGVGAGGGGTVISTSTDIGTTTTTNGLDTGASGGVTGTTGGTSTNPPSGSSVGSGVISGGTSDPVSPGAITGGVVTVGTGDGATGATGNNSGSTGSGTTGTQQGNISTGQPTVLPSAELPLSGGGSLNLMTGAETPPTGGNTLGATNQSGSIYSGLGNYQNDVTSFVQQSYPSTASSGSSGTFAFDLGGAAGGFSAAPTSGMSGPSTVCGPNSISAYDMVAGSGEAGAFALQGDQAYIDQYYPKDACVDTTLSPKVAGTLQMVGGTLQVAGGTVETILGGISCPETGIGCAVAVAGVSTATFGLDNITAGSQTRNSNQFVPTVGQTALQNLGFSQTAATWTYVGVQTVVGLGSSYGTSLLGPVDSLPAMTPIAQGIQEIYGLAPANYMNGQIGYGASALQCTAASFNLDQAVVTGSAAALPEGYVPNLINGTVTGPKGGIYTSAGAADANGNPIYVGGNGNYYTLSADGSVRVPSPNPPSGIGVTGQIGEDYLKTLGGQSYVSFDTTQGLRIVDQVTAGNIANESKVGFVGLDAETALQVSKDTELLNTGAVNGVTWHFFPSPVTGLSGPSTSLYNALDNAGFNVIFHP